MNKKPTYKDLERRIEELVKDREDRFKELLRNSFDMLVLIDADGIQRYVSDSSEKILGYKAEELTNIRVIENMIHPDDKSHVLDGFKGILEKRAHGGAQYRHLHKNGNWVYLEAFGNNQLDNPHINAIVLNVRDISERKKAEDEIKESELRLKQLNATKDRFFSIIAHDLKSPFCSILGISDLLIGHVRKGNYNQLEKYAILIKESADRTNKLLTNLLDWAQTQRGKIRFNPKKIDLCTIVEDTIKLFQDSANQKSIVIVNGIKKRILVFADERMLSTVVRNLISNGIKFTQLGGELQIFSGIDNGDVQVSVSDNGVGMDREIVSRLFRIDFSQTTPGTLKETGTGLGLLLCKEFIEMHKGKIWVESELGEGSTFYFLIPSGV